MSVLNWFSLRSQAPLPRRRWASKFMGALSFALMQGCAVHAPSCDGRFEPINAPAPVHDIPAQEDRSVERDTDDE